MTAGMLSERNLIKQVLNKSRDNIELDVIAALLRDVQSLHSEVYTPRDRKLDYRKVERRLSREGPSFLTKALPRLGKAFKRALSGEVSFDSTGWCKSAGSKLPRFLGGLFKGVFTLDGWVLLTPCVACIATITRVLDLWYKLELQYDKEQEQEVLNRFKESESDLLDLSVRFSYLASNGYPDSLRAGLSHEWPVNKRIITSARRRLRRLFANFDPKDIKPRHGPGVVSTRENLEGKWTFRNVPDRIARLWPVDAYYYANTSHFTDDLKSFYTLGNEESQAKVILVPKDSRGPRLISCEPLEFMWIQQGMMRAMVELVESHPLTRYNVNFTDQQPNQRGALLGSSTGRYATLDLKDASDRVTVGLVHLLFPEGLTDHLMNCRSLSTVLPSGESLTLNKFAPMGSALCFPILALTIWAILTAGAPDADTREGILVYGDDVIVPTAFAANAIELLESFGLKINRDKSCINGSFRESCGVEAFAGVNITPVRIRTVWSSSQCPHVYASWISYANSMYERRMFNTYDVIADRLFQVYGDIPHKSSHPRELSLVEVPVNQLPRKKRWNSALQKVESKINCVRSPSVSRETDGWKMLHRYFVEGPNQSLEDWQDEQREFLVNFVHLSHGGRGFGNSRRSLLGGDSSPFQVRAYTKRNTVKFVKRWR